MDKPARIVFYVASSTTRQEDNLSFPIYGEWTISLVLMGEKKESGWNSLYMGESCKGHNNTIWW